MNRHRIFYQMPKKLPPYTTAFVNLNDKESLSLLLESCQNDCIIVARSDGSRMKSPIAKLIRKKFRLQDVSAVMSDVTCTGEVFLVFVRGHINTPRAPNIAYLGDSCLYPSYYAVGDTVDMFCFGQKFHERAVQTDSVRTLVFAKE